MLRTLALVAVLASFARAEPDPPVSGPPSKTLERAIKLYDKKDFFSASIELRKVVDGESGDDTVNKQRAQFFTGKTLYQMGFYGASEATFSQIVATGNAHTYYNASQKWISGLAPIVPQLAPALLAQYKSDEPEDPSLESVRGDLRFWRGIDRLRNNDFGTAATELGKVPRDSKVWPQAQIALGIAQLRAGHDKEALAALGASTDPLASLIAGQLHVGAKAWDKAIAAFGAVKGPLAARAAWEASWARMAKAGRTAPLEKVAVAITTPILEPQGPEPAVLHALLTFEICAKPGARADGLDAFRKEATKLHDQLAAIAKGDDSAELFARHARALRDGTEKDLSPRGRFLTRALLAGPSASAAFGFVEELDHELDLLRKSDKAWQTTQVASNILEETTLQQAIAAADAGRLVHDRLLRLGLALDALAAGPPVPVGPDGFTVVCP